MSYWPPTTPSAAGNTPPLPPRDSGNELVPTPDAVPRPTLPPRLPAARIPRKAVPSSGVQAPSFPAQNGPSTPAVHHQYPSTAPGISTNQTSGYPDISHLFPDGKIPPPPPLPAHLMIGGSSQAPLHTGITNTPLQVPDAPLPTVDASTTPPIQSQGIAKECISTNVTFAATWYTHHRAPDFPICMNCYENQIRGSRFAAEFRGTFHEDGEPRACGFNSPRLKDNLWESALSSGSLDRVVEYLVRRPTIPGCVGQGGVKGSAGIKWYRARNNDIPAMVVCQACYEDLILAHPEFGVDHFEPSTISHAADQTWSCDMAVPYIQREYKVRALTNDWHSFVQGVSVRMSLKPCPGEKTVYPTQKWFTPVRGPQGLLICVACYCDYILLTGLSSEWQDAGDDLASRFGVSVSCFIGRQFNVRALAARTLDTNDYDWFWKAMDVVCRSPMCQSKMQNATWYTLNSDPNGFEICSACYVSIVVPMGVYQHFKPKEDVPPDSKITCSFNPAIARFRMYMSKLLEMVYKQDQAPLEEFIKEYAFMPECRRDRHVENARWFGWDECTICAECHHEFIRGTALAEAMPHQGTLAAGRVMCEMYSQRMRQLYLAACGSNPPDPKPLLEYSVQRRSVWKETVPRARQIMSDIQLKSFQQSMALNNSMFYTWSGGLMQNTLPLEQTSGSAAIGYGHFNHMQIKGAEYGRQATAIGNDIRGAPAHIADELMQRWRAVE
ncbi:hypothetical protein F5Y07DRAFT_387404 [Xylaria sp. FL0933]|nr:hypothetical protein F5Y07DRAFT_387404 [Xylaria sp. FL0933]